VGFRGRHEDEWGVKDAFIQYALMDSARAYRLGLSADENRAQIAELWSTLSAVAAGNPAAWEQHTWSAASILDHSRPGNRPVAWPYSVKLITQMYVDQAASLIVCSTDAARRLGIPADRWVYPAVAVDCEVTVPLIERSSPGECPQWNVIADAFKRERGGRPFDTIDYVDLYSCFPIAVTHQLDAFGFKASHPITVTGGMTFGGGPLNNAALQAMARCVELIARSDADSEGFVTAVSGLLTKQGALLLRRSAPARPYRRIDVTQSAEPLVGRREVVGRYTGVGVIEAATVVFPKDEAPELVAIVRTADGSGTVARGNGAVPSSGGAMDALVGSQVDVVDGALSERPASD
jgi:acetyl-CoA C-acetyltransferase